MRVQHSLLILPIHGRSFQEYYSAHDRFVESQKPSVEEQWGGPFDDLPAHIRIRWKDRWYWPPWLFNDVVGFLKIGTTESQGLAADIYLKRRHFPLTAPERLYRDRERTKDREQFLHFWSLEQHRVDSGDNATYVAAAHELSHEAEATVQRYGRGAASAAVWQPDYGIECFDFARAHQQVCTGSARQQAPGEADLETER